jgi:D-glycero-alpha-D-manno-heptose-7-phosphate kinase
LAPGTIREMEKHMLLVYTGQSRLSGDIIRTVMGAYERNERRTVEALRNLKRIAYETKNALLAGDLHAFAALLDENWRNQKALDASVTNERIDRLFDVAYRSGAIGGKASGAGGGGCVIFYADDDKEHLVRKAVIAEGAQIIDFNFEESGLQTWVSSRPD